MKAASFAITLLMAALLTACVRTPSVSQQQAIAIAAAATTILMRTGPAAIPAGEWPVPIRVLDPKRVRVAAEGLYVVTGKRFAEEVGVFVPRDPAGFSPAKGGDPEFRQLHGHVFSYRVRG